jgi:hypothetical protein
MKTTLQTPPPPAAPAYDPQLPFYGPGALACWHLSLLCVLLTWTLHPIKSFVHLNLTPDVAFYTLYACLAAGHMAVQTSRFSAAEVAQLTGAGALGWNDARVQSYDVTRGMDEGMKAMVAGLNVSFRVAVYFFWVGGCVLGAVVWGKRVWPRRMGGVRRRARALPWMVAGAEAWTVGCFGWVAAKCGFWAVVSAFWQYSIIMGMLVGASVMGGYVILFSSGLVYTLPRYSIWPEIQEFWRDGRANGVDYNRLFGIAYWNLFLMPVIILQAAAAAWVLYRAVPLWGFPGLGVTMTGLDQLLGLCTGLVAVAFVSSSLVEARFGDWMNLYVWVRAEWDKEMTRSYKLGKEPKGRDEASTDVELAGLSPPTNDTGRATGWKYA